MVGDETGARARHSKAMHGCVRDEYTISLYHYIAAPHDGVPGLMGVTAVWKVLSIGRHASASPEMPRGDTRDSGDTI